MAAGVALAAAGLASMGLFVSVEGGYPSVLGGLVAMGAGMGLSMTPSTEAITGALPGEQQGVASALNDVTREFGTALGVAVLGALVATGYRRALDDRLGGVDGVPRGTADTAREGIANAVEVAPGAGPHAQALLRAARQSFVDGWQEAMWAGAAVMVALFVLVVVRGPENGPRPGDDEAAIPGAGAAEEVPAH
ncbi:hypothetical protein QFZ63_002315 [Streptomyces sp. B3I7]|nr:hypothetical protein [Streptomyces sp. B3I7]